MSFAGEKGLTLTSHASHKLAASRLGVVVQRRTVHEVETVKACSCLTFFERSMYHRETENTRVTALEATLSRRQDLMKLIVSCGISVYKER